MAFRLLIADMDSTIIENECIDELADAVGVGETVAAITERAMRGELDFEDALRERVGMLVGLQESQLQDVFENRIQLTPGARALTDGLHAIGAKCILVSGGFTFFTGRVAEAAGFDGHHANQLEFENGELTGKVIDPILGADAKVETMQRYMRDMDLSAHEVLAVGDGANDIPMLKAAGLGVAFCPKPVAAEAADTVVSERDLRLVLDAACIPRPA